MLMVKSTGSDNQLFWASPASAEQRKVIRASPYNIQRRRASPPPDRRSRENVFHVSLQVGFTTIRALVGHRFRPANHAKRSSGLHRIMNRPVFRLPGGSVPGRARPVRSSNTAWLSAPKHPAPAPSAANSSRQRVETHLFINRGGKIVERLGSSLPGCSRGKRVIIHGYVLLCFITTIRSLISVKEIPFVRSQYCPPTGTWFGIGLVSVSYQHADR
jgi:hypothetical protein